MKAQLDRIIKHIALITLILSAVIMAYIVYELSITKNEVARSLVDKTIDKTQHELEDFFIPVKNQLNTSALQAQMKPILEFSKSDYNELFVPIIKNYPQISSLGIATNNGFEHDVILGDHDGWFSREVDIDKTGFFEFWNTCELKNNLVHVDSAWVDSAQYDPRTRPWFLDNDHHLHSISWTDPYIFLTNRLPGITVSKGWTDPYNDSIHVVLAFDFTLEKINEFTKKLHPTANGQVLITTKDKLFIIGAPHNDHVEGDVNQTLSPTNEIKQKELQRVLNDTVLDTPFKFDSGGDSWWGVTTEFKLSEKQSFMILIALPESDFLSELNKSQRLMSGGFLGILLLTFLIMRSHNKQVKSQKLLRKKNEDIVFKNKLISHKNKEILDSITYAKRIQSAILPTERIVKSYLDDSFVLYLPKDIVAGDFYWMEHLGDSILFAAADCTGHGVPGAMVSVMCHNALNRSVKEFNLTSPEQILNKTRELVLEEFSQSEDDMNDGMDISLCSLNRKTNELLWSGANNPLWIISEEGEKIQEIKADKQPVGRHSKSVSFTLHSVKLNKGDTIYIFTDGLQDQFGGPKGKKFKPTRLRSLFLSVYKLPLNVQRDKIKEEFDAWRGEHEQVDDICIIAVKV
jgi:serine phosphatase RsbU (regulator of sigma subunit)